MLLFMQILEGIVQEARCWNYDVKIEPLFVSGNEMNTINQLGFPHCDGIILLGMWELTDFFGMIKERNIPFVGVSTMIMDKPDIPEVATELYTGIGEAFDYLLGDLPLDRFLFQLQKDLPGLP